MEERKTLSIRPVHHGWSSCYLLQHEEELTLIDTGRPGFFHTFAKAFREFDRNVEELDHIVLTHSHPDHCGNVNALREASGAQVWMSEGTAAMLAEGRTFNPYTPRPDPLAWMIEKTVITRAERQIEPIRAAHIIQPGDVLPIARGLEAIATPGHCTGQLAFFTVGGGALFVGDAAVSLPWLNLPYIAEDWEEARRNAATLAGYDFVLAYFGHGNPLEEDAAARFRRKWGEP